MTKYWKRLSLSNFTSAEILDFVTYHACFTQNILGYGPKNLKAIMIKVRKYQFHQYLINFNIVVVCNTD